MQYRKFEGRGVRWGKIGVGGFPKSSGGGGVTGVPPSWMGVCGVHWFFFAINHSGKLRNSGFHVRGKTVGEMEDFKKKEEKGKKRGDFFLFCAPLLLATEVKIDGSNQKRRKIGDWGVIFWWRTPLFEGPAIVMRVGWGMMKITAGKIEKMFLGQKRGPTLH